MNRRAAPDRAPGWFASHSSLRRALAQVTLGALLFPVFCATALGAADDNKIIFPSGGARPAAPAVPAVGGSMLNTVTLVLALALAGVGAWLMWRSRRATGAGHAGRALAIEETRSLGNRQYLIVASYEDKKFLLGVCPGRIDMLAPLDHGSRSDASSRENSRP